MANSIPDKVLKIINELGIPPEILESVGDVFEHGRKKRSQKNGEWKDLSAKDKKLNDIYYHKLIHHLVRGYENLDPIDPDSKQHHFVHVIVLSMIMLNMWNNAQGK
jgi:hypothetical protein